jgi:hypothetical protein
MNNMDSWTYRNATIGMLLHADRECSSKLALNRMFCWQQFHDHNSFTTTQHTDTIKAWNTFCSSVKKIFISPDGQLQGHTSNHIENSKSKAVYW